MGEAASATEILGVLLPNRVLKPCRRRCAMKGGAPSSITSAARLVSRVIRR
jgi:hypothetical protein